MFNHCYIEVSGPQGDNGDKENRRKKTMEKEQSLGKRIAELRKMKGLTQEQLGEKLGVSAQAVSNGKTTSVILIYLFCPS